MGGWRSSAAARAHKARMGGSSATSTSFARVRPRIGSSGRTPRSWIRSVPCSRPTGGDSPTARPTGPGHRLSGRRARHLRHRRSRKRVGVAADRRRRDVSAAVRRLVRRRSPGRLRRPTDVLRAIPIGRRRVVRSGSQRSQTATSTCCRTCWPPTWSGRLTAHSSLSRAARPTGRGQSVGEGSIRLYDADRGDMRTLVGPDRREPGV